MIAEEIIYKLDKKTDDIFTISNEFVAFKGGVCYPVYISGKIYISGMSIGSMRAIFDQDTKELLDTATPMFGFNKGFELIPINCLKTWKKTLTMYNRYMRANKNLYKKKKK